MLDNTNSPVIVLGMHRSGTSLLTGSLQAAGLHLGDVNDFAPHNRKGNKEHETLRSLNDELLARVGCDWKTPPVNQLPLLWTASDTARAVELTANLRASGQVWGFKDPRAIWTLEGWLDLFPQARLVGIFRHPAHVIASLTSRPGALALTREQSASLWKVTNERLLELKHKHGFELLEFDSANGATAFHNRIDKVSAALGLTAKTEPFYSSDLVNNSGEAEDISSDLRTVYEALQAEASSD
tara:strand:+ start:6809 stop:7531 length:723 start_codon:yes stop_codon:yes gene_type:complete